MLIFLKKIPVDETELYRSAKEMRIIATQGSQHHDSSMLFICYS